MRRRDSRDAPAPTLAAAAMTTVLEVRGIHVCLSLHWYKMFVLGTVLFMV
jgi:hypothetical protein